MDNLATEAKKYKTADEFVKANFNTLYEIPKNISEKIVKAIKDNAK